MGKIIIRGPKSLWDQWDRGPTGPFSFEKYLNSPLRQLVKILINYNLLKQLLTFI